MQKEINITLSLVADSPDELSMLTVQRQVLWGLKLKFYDFSQLKNGKYICWYNVPHTIWVEKVANGKV